MSVIIPRFDDNSHSMKVLAEDSWREIFDPVCAEENKQPVSDYRRRLSGCRKVAQVRLAHHNGLMVPQGKIEGLLPDVGHYWRKIYGVVLFHIRDVASHDIKFSTPFQLCVSLDARFQGDVTHVSVYMTPKTRIEDRTYYINRGKISLGAIIDVKKSDYDFGLLRTDSMLKWNYCPPPLKLN